MMTSQHPSRAALPAKQRPDTTPTSEAPADVNAEPAPADESAETGEGMPAAEEAPAEPAQAPDTASDTAPDTGTKPATLPWELWVEVDGAPGQPYVLQHFERRDVYTFREEGPHWVSSIHAGAAADSIDATVLVTETPPDKPERFLTAAAPLLCTVAIVAIFPPRVDNLDRGRVRRGGREPYAGANKALLVAVSEPSVCGWDAPDQAGQGRRESR